VHRVGIALLLVGFVSFTALPLAGPAAADPAIHEIVAAYCSGGGVGAIDANGFLEPPGITGGSNANNFAQPVFASGSVAGTFPNLVVTSKPNAKYVAGTNALTGLSATTVSHPSAARCPGAAVLP
jgi:hypothetical protein